MSDCFDCPDLALSPDCPPEGIKLRPTCCRDDYIELRKIGHFEAGWPGLEEGRRMVDEFQTEPSKPGGNRHQRRAKAATQKGNQP